MHRTKARRPLLAILVSGMGAKFEFEVAECTEFSLYHLMDLQEGEEGAFLCNFAWGGRS